MTDPTAVRAPTLPGKLAPEAFARLIAPHLGLARPEVLVGPAAGRDAAIVRAGAGRVLALSSDPLSVIPALGLARSAWLACHLIASDVWTTGIPPAYASVEFHLPPQFDDAALAEYAQAMSEAWKGLGVAVVTGHTGRYADTAAGAVQLLGSATLVGVGDEGRYVTPAMAKPGEVVILTKGCAIETAAIAAALIPQRLRTVLDEEGLGRLRALEREVSVVADCRAAVRAGVRDHGVTAMHDATEGGVLGALVELAMACGHDVRVEKSRLHVAPEVKAACEALGVDPYTTLSEGALLVCARPERAPFVLGELDEDGIQAAVVGEVLEGNGRLWVAEADGKVTTLDAPPADPYWPAYARAVREGWR